MLIPNNIWTAYGIKTAPDESYEMQTLSPLIERSSNPQPSLILDTSSAPTTVNEMGNEIESGVGNRVENTFQPTTTFAPAVPAAPSASNSPEVSYLSPAAVAGVCIGVVVGLVLVACAVLRYCVLGKRRERALRGAVEGSQRTDSGSALSREDAVMEGKSGVLVGEEEVWEVETGRKGMSLPRRVW